MTSDRPVRNRIIGGRIVERPPRTTGAPATMMQFPITRQHNVIEKVAAAVMRKRSAGAADRCVGAALRKFTDEMRRQGIPQATVKREVRLMEALIRAAVWRLMFPWVNDEQVRTRGDADKLPVVPVRLNLPISLVLRGIEGE